MAVYKVIQDIEAEDKLIGPLGLKGFIYALIAGFCAFIDFRLLLFATPLKWLLIFMFALPMILFGVLASPLGRDQPTEVWLLSRIRFLTKPRRRIWDQSGIAELVTITAPKRPQRQLTKGFSQSEVQSRLKALAATLDSRGWAVKNVDVNIGATPSYLEQPDDERLIDASTIPKEVPPVEVHASDDILDEKNNQTAKSFQDMIQKADSDRKQALIERVKKAAAEAPATAKQTDERVDVSVLDRMTVGLDNPGYTTFTERRVVEPGQKKHEKIKNETVTDQEKRLLERIHREEADIHSRAPSFVAKSPLKRPAPPMTQPQQAANMELAQTDNVLPLSVASVEHLANRQAVAKQIGPNEVELDLH